MISDNSFSEYNNVPIPIAIVVHNLLAPISSAESKSKKWFRLDHATNLLVSVRLEIVLIEGDVSKLIFSSQYEQSSTRPMWDHLNERIKDWEQDWFEQSSSAFVRIIFVDKNGDNSVLVDSVPLHPKYLRRLPGSEENLRLDQSPPSALPPNAVLIHYDDGLVRVEASLYHVLLNQGAIHEENPRDVSLIIDDAEEDRRKLRFHDDLFDVLDQVKTNPTAVQTSSLGTGVEDLEASVQVAEKRDSKNDERAPSFLHHCKEIDIDIEDSLTQRERLLAEIATEEVLLFDDQEELELQRQQILATIEHVEQIEQEETSIQAEICQVISDRQKLEVSVDLYQVKLLAELQQIYPIVYKVGERYEIAGAELPIDIFGGEISEDETSAALGFLAHSLVMMSKYLSIPLRYRIVCNSSRSAIQEEGRNILPLFLARNCERQPLEHGLVLLHRNVDCIAKSRGLECRGNHILVKVQAIYQKVLKTNQ